jgi:hypothetical protein
MVMLVYQRVIHINVIEHINIINVYFRLYYICELREATNCKDFGVRHWSHH